MTVWVVTIAVSMWAVTAAITTNVNSTIVTKWVVTREVTWGLVITVTVKEINKAVTVRTVTVI